MSEESNALVPAQPAAGALVPAGDYAARLLGLDGDAQMWCSLRPETDEARYIIAHARQTNDRNGGDLIGQEIEVANVLLHPVTMLVNEATGETVDAVRTVLIAPDGSTVGFVSEGVRKSVALLCYTHKPPPWYPALKVTIKQVTTSKKRKSLYLEVSRPATLAAPKRGKAS